jgi:YbgC/YbaW family acyl-CoA thioester hydrolase
MKASPYEFKLKRQVEFGDTDMAGIMHFSNFFRFMEATETAFFRSLGLSIVTTGFDNPIGWPRVHADCDFIRPLRFEDTVEIHLLVREKKKRSIVYGFIFRNLNEDPAPEVARGTLVVACVTRDSHSGKMVSVPIPPAIADKIGVAPKEVLEKIDET